MTPLSDPTDSPPPPSQRQADLGHYIVYCLYAWDVLSATGGGRVRIYTIGGHIVTILLSGGDRAAALATLTTLTTLTALATVTSVAPTPPQSRASSPLAYR